MDVRKIKIVGIWLLGLMIFSPTSLYSQNKIQPENNFTKEFFSIPNSYEVMEKVISLVPDFPAIYSPGEAKLKITDKGFIEEFMNPPQSYIFEKSLTGFSDKAGVLYQFYEPNDISNKVVVGVFLDKQTNNCYFDVFCFKDPQHLVLMYYLVIKGDFQCLEIIKDILEEGKVTSRFPDNKSEEELKERNITLPWMLIAEKNRLERELAESGHLSDSDDSDDPEILKKKKRLKELYIWEESFKELINREAATSPPNFELR